MSEMLLSQIPSVLSLVKPKTADISDIKLSPRYSTVRLISSDNDVMSEIELRPRCNDVRLVKPETVDISDIAFQPRYSCVSLVNSDNDVMSEIELSERYSRVSLVNPDNDAMSEIELSERSSDVRSVNPVNNERSEIELSRRCSRVRLIACSSPVKSLMLDALAVRLLNAAISDMVMESPDALPNSVAIAARRLESGIVTVCAVDVDGIERKINRIKIKR